VAQLAAGRDRLTGGGVRGRDQASFVKLRRLLARIDEWLDPTVELWAGCIVLVLSARFWIDPAHLLWDLAELPATTGAIVLGPLLVYRAWKRKPSHFRCDKCGERAPLVEVGDDRTGRFFVIDCEHCSPHLSPR
jgi:hypothetical protein